MVEYIDLQWPGLPASFETSVLPRPSFPSLVRFWESSRIEARPIAIIGPDSLPGAQCRAIRGPRSQNRAFNFHGRSALTRTQGTENTGWAEPPRPSIRERRQRASPRNET